MEIKIIRLKGPRWIDSDNANDMCAWVVEKWKQGARQFIALSPIVHDPSTDKEGEK